MLVVGSSVGAMNGAYYAGVPTPEGIERLAAIWRGLRRRDIFPITPRAIIGEAMVLSQGDAAQAIVASTAIPAAFAPVEFDGHCLADGAITSWTPAQVALMLGATRLIVLPTKIAACARCHHKAPSPTRCMR